MDLFHFIYYNVIRRAIIHLDADAFYAGVEKARLKLGEDEPLAVQQWSSLIAVDYASRKYGVKRGMNAEEAKKMCPNLRLVHVELLDGAKKVSLRRYREASYKVLQIFSRFIGKEDVLGKAGLDEAYLDLTASCNELMSQEETPFEDVAKYSFVVGTIDRASPHDQILVHAASIVKRIRGAVMKELGYSISAGIASNKLLAKVKYLCFHV